MMKKIALAAVAAGIALTGCTVQAPAASPAPVVTVTETPAPATSTPGDTFLLGILEDVWEATSVKERESLCWLYNTEPDMAWNAFSEGDTSDVITRETFDYFFGEKCAGVY